MNYLFKLQVGNCHNLRGEFEKKGSDITGKLFYNSKEVSEINGVFLDYKINFSYELENTHVVFDVVGFDRQYEGTCSLIPIDDRDGYIFDTELMFKKVYINQ